jgi:putative ABC transport system permease protein
VDTLRQDIHVALRSFLRSPGFAAIVVITLAVGIGAITAVFSVVDGVLLRPLRFSEPERVVQIWSGAGADPHGPTSSANFLDLRSRSRSFEAIAAEDFSWFNLTAGASSERPERLYGAHVTPSFFRALGVRAAIGRVLADDEESPDARVAVLDHGVWVRQFGSDTGVVGRRITLNAEAYTVVGVMPPGFDFPSSLIHTRIDLWVPLAWKPGEVQRGMRELGITARLARGVTLTQAQREVDGVAARLAEEFPHENERVSVALVPLREELVGKSETPLLLLFGAVSLVLVIACANVANLLLGRAQGRRKEMALRAALGAGRRRIVRQLLTESVLLALAAGAVGAFLAVWMTDLIVALSADELPRVAEIHVDGRVLFFALGVSVLTGLCFGVAPALHLAGARLAESLRAAGRSLADRSERRRGRRVLVVLEIALALVLLVSAGLLLRSLQQLLSVDPGFDSRAVLTARVALPQSKYATADRQAGFMSQAIGRIAALPGVDRVAAVNYLPFSGSDADFGISIEGRVPTPGKGDFSAHFRSVSEDYFDAMRIPLARGRAFAASDRKGAPPVALVNHAMAHRYWPDTDPIGRRVRFGDATSTEPWLTIVGVVGNVKHWDLRETDEPELFVPLAQSPASTFSFVIRTAREARDVAGPVRSALLDVDREQPATIQPLRDLVTGSVAGPRFRGVLFGAFAATALVLAVIGIYGVISFGVSQRTRELGVRVALGAQRIEVMGLVLREGMLLTGVGVALGLLAAFSVTRLLQDMLFQVPPADPLTFAAVSLLVIATAMLANVIPARRAARVDPLVAMRSE